MKKGFYPTNKFVKIFILHNFVYCTRRRIRKTESRNVKVKIIHILTFIFLRIETIGKYKNIVLGLLSIEQSKRKKNRIWVLKKNMI